MNTINFIDIIVIAVYFVITFIFGAFGSKILKNNSKESEGFFLAGRNMPGWLNGISFAATVMNADVAPAYVGVAVIVGLPICWFYMSRFGMMLLLAGMLFFPLWRRLGVSTGPEFFSLRFGGRGGTFVRIYTSLWSVCFNMIPWIGAGLLGIHMILSPYLNVDNKSLTIGLIVPILLLYIWIAGFSGVLIADLIQTSVVIISSIFICLIVLMKFGGPHGLYNSIVSVLPNQSSNVLSVWPSVNHRMLSPIALLGWFFLLTTGAGGAVGFEGQRVISCRSSKEAIKVGIWSELALFIMLLLITLPALGALANHPELYNATPVQREKAYGIMLSEFLPIGLRGLALAALVAAVMSSISGHLNYGSQTLVNDVALPVTKSAFLKNNQVWLGRIFMLVIMVIAIIVVYFATSLIGIAITVVGFYSSIALMNWAQWWWWRVNKFSWITANVGGPVIYLLSGYVLQNFTWWQRHMAMDETMQQQLGLLKAFICVVANTLVWISVTILTKPEDMKVLKGFYLKARPLGYWKPVRDALIKDGFAFEPIKNNIIGGIYTAFTGFLWICFLVLGLSSLYTGQYLKMMIFMMLTVISIWHFRKVFSWHMDRMEPDKYKKTVDIYEVSETKI